MKTEAYPSAVPSDSKISSYIEGADFYDAWSIVSNDTEQTALEFFIKAAQKTPKWVDTCMIIRNRIGSLVGLKDLGTLANISDKKLANAYKAGERISIFTVFENHYNEALIGDEDKHLNVILSIHRQRVTDKKQIIITITTVVHTKNLLGRLYMIPVKPMHKLIAPAVINNID